MSNRKRVVCNVKIFYFFYGTFLSNPTLGQEKSKTLKFFFVMKIYLRLIAKPHECVSLELDLREKESFKI